MELRALRWALLIALGNSPIGCESDPSVPASCMQEQQLTIYERRIQPLLVDDHPSTCNQCHLAGIELADYAQADECRTMACMVDEGIVDLKHPERSVVLGWILRGTPDSSLITANVIQEEHDGMLEWIEHHASCNGAVCEDYDDPCGHGPHVGKCEVPPSAHDLPPREFDDPGDCSDKTLETAFDTLVYSWRGRCNPCHYDTFVGDEEDDGPRWIAIGDCNESSLRTMRTVVRDGYIDTKSPADSLLLTKPLAGVVDHDGGEKFFDTSDAAYRDFLRWIERWAACHPE